MKQVNIFSSSQHSRLQLQNLKTGTYIYSLHDQINILISNSSFSRKKKGNQKKKSGISYDRRVKFLNLNDCYSCTKINCVSSTPMQHHLVMHEPQQPNTRKATT